MTDLTFDASMTIIISFRIIPLWVLSDKFYNIFSSRLNFLLLIYKTIVLVYM
jgi:hypothetical protein